MAVFPIFQLPLDSTKIRFKEPFTSEALNLKTSGILPPGIYRGYIPNPEPNFQLFINTDGGTNDSIAVVEKLDNKNYNLTVRHIQQIVLDFTGQPATDYPLLVVLRSKYSINHLPFGGETDAKVLAVKPTLNDADPQSLNTGDIKICRVTGILAGPNIPLITTNVSTDRDEVGGVVTQEQFKTRMKIVVGEFPGLRDPGGDYTIVHNFGLTGITPIGALKSLYQTDQGMLLVIPYMTGFGEFSDTSTDLAFLAIKSVNSNDVVITRNHIRQGRVAFNCAVLLFVGVQAEFGGGGSAPSIFLTDDNDNPIGASGINFGPVVVGTSASFIIRVYNVGSQDLNVSSLTGIAPPFTEVNTVVGTPVPFGGYGTITVTFSPTVTGLQTDTLTINSDDPHNPTLNVQLSGTGV